MTEERPEPDEPSPIEEAAGGKLGVQRWDRPLIFRDAADAAVDNDLTYWLVLALSGAIATLGLALDSAAVVIGAMLVAPLLAPIVGLSLALAVGDVRLALQTGTVVAGSLIVVILTAAALTALLPFQTVTLQISSRIHPTTLDLGIAIFSGLVGAIVTVARGHRISAAIPGVAVAVALIPPLAVAGFGIAANWRPEVIGGSLLLLGANLAGIVLSGVLLFLLIGMHRGDVVEAAREWHEGARANGLARLACRLPGVGRARVFGSAPSRVGLVLAFAVALAIPLTAALREVAREIRVRGAVKGAVSLLQADSTTTVLAERVELGDSASIALIRVATARGVAGSAREAFRRSASAAAGEPVELVLEQLPLSAEGESGSALEALLAGGSRRDPERPWPESIDRAMERLDRAAATLPLPDSMLAIGATLVIATPTGGEAGGAGDSAAVAYLAPARLQAETADVLGRSLRQAVGHPGLAVSFEWEGPAIRSVSAEDTAALGAIGLLLRRHGLAVELRGADGDSAAARRLAAGLLAAGADSTALMRRTGSGPLELRLVRP